MERRGATNPFLGGVVASRRQLVLLCTLLGSILVILISLRIHSSAILMHIGIALVFVTAILAFLAIRNQQAFINLTRDFSDNSGLAEITCDAAGTIVFSNRTATEIYGWKPSELMDHNVSIIEVKPGPHTAGAGVQERFHRKRDGEEFAVEVSSQQFVIGREVFSKLTIRDISERKRLEADMNRFFKEVEASNALKDRLFTILAHDLRGPIGNLSTLIGMAADGFVEIGVLEELLPNLRRSANSAYDLLDNLLNWVRSSLSEISVLKTRIELGEVSEKVKKWLDPVAAQKGIKIVVETESFCSAVADKMMVETIIRNFVSNAIKFSPPESEIRIRSFREAPKGRIGLEVVDSGPGIEPERIGKLFAMDPGKRTKGTAGETGSGLGLSFCSELAAKTGAEIHVKSTMGSGSSFLLSFADEVDGDLVEYV